MKMMPQTSIFMIRIQNKRSLQLAIITEVVILQICKVRDPKWHNTNTPPQIPSPLDGKDILNVL
jgi:hypothetical protein